MALVFADGFDHYGSGATGRTNMQLGTWASVEGSVAPSNSQKRTGAYSLNVANANSNIQFRKALPGAGRLTLGLGFGFMIDVLPTNEIALGVLLDNANNSLCSYSITQQGAIRARRGYFTSGTILGVSANNVIVPGAFNHIETKFVIDATAGSFESRVNGVPVLALTGQNTGNAAAAGIQFNANSGASAGTQQFYDDMIIWDNTGSVNNDFMGQQRVITVMPGADTAQADWTKNGAGTGYGCINQAVQDGDTTYIEGVNVGDVSEFNLAALPPEALDIAGVFTQTIGKLKTGGVGNVLVSMKSGGSTLDGIDTPLTTTYTYWPSVFERDPNGVIKWTKTSLAAAGLRLKKTA